VYKHKYVSYLGLSLPFFYLQSSKFVILSSSGFYW